MTEETAQHLASEISGSLALVTLDRPRALNSLTDDMRARIGKVLWSAARDPQVYAVVIQSATDRAFCAGSDVREIAGWGRSDIARARQAFRDEYSLNWQCECFSKPTVPLIDGMVMGGGVGVTLYGTHRVAGAGYKFAMPETNIGFFPDVGVCHTLSRLPGGIGPWLALAGASIGRADAYALGLVTHCIEAAEFPAIKAALVDTWPVDPTLDDRHVDPGTGEIPRLRETIDRCFLAPTVEEIVARLDTVKDASADWARATAAELRRRSPLALKMTLRQLRRSTARDLKGTLEADYRLAYRAMAGHEFYEGVRALIIDKDGAPRWQPELLEDVTEAMLDDLFAPLGPEELVLPTRSEMQEARA